MKKIKRIMALLVALAVVMTAGQTQGNAEAATKKMQPKKVKVAIVGQKKVKLTWKKIKNVRKYEVYQSTKKNKGYKKVATVVKCSYTNRSQKRGKKYYYKVRALKMEAGKKVYGSFSAVKSVLLPKQTSVSQTPIPTKIPAILSEKSNMYFTVDEITDTEIKMTSETNAKKYVIANPANPDIVVGGSLKLIAPVIDSQTANSDVIKITSYSSLVKLNAGQWFIAGYVVSIKDGVINLANTVSGKIITILNTMSNEIVVTKNNQVVVLNDIKPGDQLQAYTHSGMVVTMPGQIVDCTKINILP